MDKEQSAKTLWDISDDIDTACVELKRIGYMLQILEEGLEKDLEFLKMRQDQTGAYYYVNRYDLHRAQLGMIEQWLDHVIHKVQETSDQIREYDVEATV